MYGYREIGLGVLMPARVPRARKPAEQLRRRNAPELWTVLPREGCRLPAPKWPIGTASKDEGTLWGRLWALPVAVYWHQIRLEPSIAARYVTLSLERPEHASTAALERELGLTPASMARLRLVVEEPESEPKPLVDPYQHLRDEGPRR
jgi:hypothetical protein